MQSNAYIKLFNVLSPILFVLGLLIPLFSPIHFAFAQTATIEQTPPLIATMGDPVVTMPFVVTNTSAPGGASINEVTLHFDTDVYTISAATMAPAGWEVANIRNDGKGRTYVTFQSVTDTIDPLEDLGFEVVLTGLSGLNFTSDVNDQVDVLENKTDIAGFTITGGLPGWDRLGLKTSLAAQPTSLTMGSTITVIQTVINRSTVAQTIPVPPSPTPSNPVLASFISTPSTPINLSAGASGSFTYYFRADNPGTVNFTNSAVDSDGDTNAAPATSNWVVIGDITAELSVSPLRVISGQEVTASLTVRNNGSVAAQNIVPIIDLITTGSSVTLLKINGPTPDDRGWLQPGNAVTFTYTYQVTGNLGDTYVFSGYVDTDLGQTNTAVSETGEVSVFTAYVDPSNVAACSTNVTFTFVVTNNGGIPVKKLSILSPDPAFVYIDPPSPTSVYFSRTQANGNPKRITLSNGSLPSGASDIITITYSSIPCPASNTSYTFTVEITDDNNQAYTIDAPILITAYQIVLSASPNSGIPADGISTSLITATVTYAGAPVFGITVNFTGNEGSLSSSTGVTNASGQATVTLTAPASVTDVIATVQGEVGGAVDFVDVEFVGVTTPNLLYFPGSLDPTVVQQAQSVSFSVDVINVGGSTMDLSTNSTFSFTDASRTYTANLSTPTSVSPGAIVTLTFNAEAVDINFTPGFYNPTLWLTDDAANSFSRAVTDQVQVIAGPVITLLKSADKANVNPGELITYTVNYQNTGADTAFNTVLVDNIPVNTTYLAGSIFLSGVNKTDASDGDECEFTGVSVQCNLGDVASGISGILIFQVQVQ